VIHFSILIPSILGFFFISSRIETISDLVVLSLASAFSEIERAQILTFFVSSPLERTFPRITTVSPSFVSWSISNRFLEVCFFVEEERILATSCHLGFFRAAAIVSFRVGFVFFLERNLIFVLLIMWLIVLVSI